MSNQIIFFYAIGIVMFSVGIEQLSDRKENNFIIMGLAAFINLIGYYVSYQDTNFTTAAYFPLLLLVGSVIFLLYWLFMEVKHISEDDYKEDNDNEDD